MVREDSSEHVVKIRIAEGTNFETNIFFLELSHEIWIHVGDDSVTNASGATCYRVAHPLLLSVYPNSALWVPFTSVDVNDGDSSLLGSIIGDLMR